MPENAADFPSGFAQDAARAERAVAASARRMAESLSSFTRAQNAAARASRNFSSAVVKSFEQAVFEGRSLSDVLRGLALDFSRATLKQALAPLGRPAASLLTRLAGAANGAVFAGGAVQPFARGGIVGGPAFFPLRSGLGVIGEAGPEAVLPLARGRDGKLGVAAQSHAARPVNVNFHITTPDAESFRRSHSQTAALLRRALARGGSTL